MVEFVVADRKKIREYLKLQKEYNDLLHKIDEAFTEFGKTYYKLKAVKDIEEKKQLEEKINQLDKEIKPLILEKEKVWKKITNHEYYGLNEEYLKEYLD